MKTLALWFMVACLGFACALGSASCGPTCPGNQPNCGSNNIGGAAAGAAGAAGASSSSTCDQLGALRSCMSDFCASTSNPFCSCYSKGFDLNTSSCACVTFDAKRFCDDQAATGAQYDCSAATGAIGTACVGVQ